MSEHKSKETKAIRESWDSRAGTYDGYYLAFRGAVENYLDWELLKKYLPQNRDAKVLDAAGGTGRMAIPLAKMGYSVTLCDISPRMLDVAKQKLLRENLLDRVTVVECDVRRLPFDDDTFDFVLCWDGGAEAEKELTRVTRKHGRISIYLVNKWASAVDRFYGDPLSALAILESSPSYIEEDGARHRVVGPEEVRGMSVIEGIRVIDTYGVCSWMDVLGIPKEVQESRDWDETLFNQTAEMLLKLSREPSVRGMSTHLVLYGEKV